MKYLTVIIVLISGIMFLYLNIRLSIKLNLSYTFVNIYIGVRPLKREYKKNIRIHYADMLKKLVNREKKQSTWYRMVMKLKRFFIIRGISLYVESLEGVQTLAFEFYIENNMLKRGALIE